MILPHLTKAQHLFGKAIFLALTSPFKGIQKLNSILGQSGGSLRENWTDSLVQVLDGFGHDHGAMI
jgi:hypothetical protein